MKCTINTSVDYIMEAIVLMYNYVNEEDYPSLKKKLVSKYSLNTDIQSKFDVIIRVSNYVYENLTIDKERLNYYFQKINKDSLCIARMLFSIQSRGGIDSMVNTVNLIKELSQSAMYSRMFDCLSDFGLLYWEDDVSNCSQEFYFEAIDKLDIEPEQKWNVSKAFINYKKYSEELSEILDGVINLIKDCIKDMDLLTKECVGYWTEYLKEKDISEFIQKYFNINLELNNVNDNIHLIPFIFGCNSLSLSVGYKETSIQKDPNYLLMHTGILYSEHFNISVKLFDKTEVIPYLKLLSDKSKMEILLYIKDKKAYGQELAKQFNLSTATISHHMSALLSSGFINLERENNRIYYSMNKENVIIFLDNVKHMLTE